MRRPETTTPTHYGNPLVARWAAVEVCEILWKQGELGPDLPPPIEGEKGHGRSFSGVVTMNYPPYVSATINWQEERDGWPAVMQQAYGIVLARHDHTYPVPRDDAETQKLLAEHELQRADRWEASGPGQLVHRRRGEG